MSEANNMVLDRDDIKDIIDPKDPVTKNRNYLTKNNEEGEFNYITAFNELNKEVPLFPDSLKISKTVSKKGQKEVKLVTPDEVDLRFEGNNLSVLVETKTRKFIKDDYKQIEAYVWWEKQYRPNNNIVSILVNMKTGYIKIQKITNRIFNENPGEHYYSSEDLDDTDLNNFSYYLELFGKRRNDKIQVLKSVNKLNDLLHKLEVKEKHRSLFVGVCLVALNEGLSISEVSGQLNSDIISKILKKIEQRLVDNENKVKKLEVITNVLKTQDIKDLTSDELISVLQIIKDELIPFIKENTNDGEDLLNLFFTTFNKYTGKADKNQAFTPTHITDFMSDLVRLDKDSRVLDPTCGSGAFLIQAMKKMLKDVSSRETKEEIKTNNIYGIEFFDVPFGLSTVNMLIHNDGKSNIVCDNCFDRWSWIQKQNINVVLMNPPFNGTKVPKLENFVNKKSKLNPRKISSELDWCPVDGNGIDKTKGWYFVHFIATVVNNGYLCTILPVSCAIGNANKSGDSEEASGYIDVYKKKMLDKHTLLGVFTLPQEVFYPGASTNACVMLFELGKKHDPSKTQTFFGYFRDDGFQKRKNLGRVEQRPWESVKDKDGNIIEKGTKDIWLDAYFGRSSQNIPGLCVKRSVTYKDEWLAEAYMETDYSKLTEEYFEEAVRDYVSFEVKEGRFKKDE